MIHEDYLPCSSYENQSAHATESGFLAFFDEPSARHFFSLVDADGKVLLKSEGYPQQAARENGIQSVIKNRVNKDFYSVKSENGKYYLSLRAANYREIARSCSCDTEAEALALLPYMTGEKIRGGQAIAASAEPKERANDKVDDDYLACREYEGHPDVGIDGYEGLVKFTHSNGKHYFAWYDEDNNLLMRSEGYPTTSARDNGMASVAKNRELEERYSTLEKFGRYFTILKAGNHQEIARSCAHDTEGGALALLPSARARVKAEKAAALAAASAATAATAALASESERREDNYLACKEYENRGVAEDGIVKWQHTDGQYYFTWVDDGGQVLMRSEGYPTTAARDNGAASVIKNRDIKERYDTIEKFGKYFMVLKAGNHQEIARSCPKEDKAIFGAWFPALGLIPLAAKVPVEAEEVTPVIDTPEPAPAAVAAPTPEPEDDYLPCREYEGHNINDKHNNVAMFKHSNGQYYFAIYHADGSVRLRSEGFGSAIDRDKELSGALKNLNNPDMYTTIRKGDYYISILKDKTGREVGRSCLQKEEPVIVVPPVEAAAVGVAAAALPLVETVTEPETPAAVAAPTPEPEDDYLPCREYEGHNINDKHNNVAMFKHSNGQYYFAIYHADGSVRLRSEGFGSAIDRDKELSGALKNLNNPDMYTTIRKGDYYMSVLKDKTGREVGRSCLQKEQPVIVVPPPVVAEPDLTAAAVGAAALGAAAFIPKAEPEVPKVVVEEPKVVVPPPPPPPIYESATAAAPAAASSGFNWWWLLLPLLALLGYFLWTKGCSGKAVDTTVTAPLPTVPPAAVPMDTVKKDLPEAPTTATMAAKSCDLNWIFFDFDKSDLRTASRAELDELVKILKDNPDYVAVLKANTDWKGSDEYNVALSNRRASQSKDYLVSKGIDAARIKTTMNGEKDPIAKNAVGNADSEEGRQLNRRVELYVQDKSGKNVCESIPPAVPQRLKVQ